MPYFLLPKRSRWTSVTLKTLPNVLWRSRERMQCSEKLARGHEILIIRACNRATSNWVEETDRVLPPHIREFIARGRTTINDSGQNWAMALRRPGSRVNENRHVWYILNAKFAIQKMRAIIFGYILTLYILFLKLYNLYKNIFKHMTHFFVKKLFKED